MRIIPVIWDLENDVRETSGILWIGAWTARKLTRCFFARTWTTI
jgi:hypothetical protein